jgi:hypothetical protein
MAPLEAVCQRIMQKIIVVSDLGIQTRQETQPQMTMIEAEFGLGGLPSHILLGIGFSSIVGVSCCTDLYVNQFYLLLLNSKTS